MENEVECDCKLIFYPEDGMHLQHVAVIVEGDNMDAEHDEKLTVQHVLIWKIQLLIPHTKGMERLTGDLPVKISQ